MRLLILAEDIAYTAPGIVYRNLIPFLSERYDVTIITTNVDESLVNIANVQLVRQDKRPRIPHWIEMKMYECLGHNLIDDYLTLRWLNKIESSIVFSDYEAVLSLTSHWHFLPITVGKKLKEKCNSLKWIIYSVDAIPAPIGWIPQIIHEKTSKWVVKIVKDSDGFFSANDQMLNYELKLLGNYRGYTGCVYTPWRPCQIDFFKKKENKDIVFLYTGNIYGLRHVRALLKGFQQYNSEEPNSKLVFVGSKIAKDLEIYQDLVKDGRIEVHGYTKELEAFIVNADVLIDIGADVDNDVFLSSKIVNYLILRRPILAITGSGSPSRVMMGSSKSIIHCSHKPEEICDAMRRAVAQMDQPIQDREKLIATFAPQNVAERFMNDIDKILKGSI